MSCCCCASLVQTSEERSALLIESMQEILTTFARAAKGELCIQCAVDEVRNVALNLERDEHGHNRV